MSEAPDASTPWRRAILAACVFAVDFRGPGVALRAAPGPARDAWLEALRAMLPAAAPWRRAPAGIADDRLLGGLDIPATLRAGRPVAQAGVLAEVDGGVLCLAMAERVPPATAARIAAALDLGEVRLARDGFAAALPSRFGLVALDEGQGDEQPPPALTERLAFPVDLGEVGRRDLEPAPFTLQAVSSARARLSGVQAGEAILEALVAVAARLGIGSLRAPLFALRAARALAALAGRTEVEDADVALAAALTLGPRATRSPEPDEEAPPPPPPEESETEPPEEKPAEEPRELSAAELEDLVLAAARAAIPPDLLARLSAQSRGPRRAAGDGKSGAANISKLRGRPLEARAGTLRDGRLGLVATLRAAAPWQASRAKGQAPGRFRVQPEDLRIVRYRQKRGATTVFVVDASGSSAMQRLAEVKGAIELLLADCYVRRDSVALVAFRNRGAELVLPPTRSTARAKRALAGLPGGGGTPVASGLDAAIALADQIRRKGQTPLIVLMTDGRANIGRDGAPGRPGAMRDALDAGRRVRAEGIAALAIDTAPPPARPDAPTRALAEAMQARYVALPYADAAKLNRAVRAAAAT